MPATSALHPAKAPPLPCRHVFKNRCSVYNLLVKPVSSNPSEILPCCILSGKCTESRKESSEWSDGCLSFQLQCSSFSPSCTLRAQNSPAIHRNDLGFCAHFPPASQVPCSFKSQLPIFPCIAIASVAGPTTYSVGVMLENIATCLMLFTLSSGV